MSKQSRSSKRSSRQQATVARRRFSAVSAPLSASSSASSQLYFNKQEEEEEEEEEGEEDLELLGNLCDTDNESTQEEEPVYLQQPILESTIDFFEEFGEVPGIDDISEDVIILKMPSKQEFEEHVSLDPNIDVGHFVNPLTGDSLSSSESKLMTDIEAPQSLPKVASSNDEAIANSEEESEISDVYGDFELTDETFETFEKEETAKVVDAAEAFEIFLEMEAKTQFIIEEEIDWATLAKEEDAKHIQHATSAFIHELIRKVVETVEYLSPNAVLRFNLDKRKLMLELEKKVQDLEIENRIQIFLNRKIIDFYKRKKIFRPILPDNAKSVDLEMAKYNDAVERLDGLLAKQSNAIAVSAKMKENLRNELSEAINLAQTEVQQFEEMVKTQLIRDNRPKCNALLDKLLLQMSQCRQEVTDVRFEFLIKQHAQAVLMEKLNEIEDLGNGLTMTNFGNLQAETQTLGKKIEERNVDLNKLHIRVRNDIHLIAHYKEKQKMLRNAIGAQRMALDELNVENQMWREKIHRLKMERGRIRQQINELSFKGGLVDKPALMLDYDRTCEKVEERRDLVNYLRETQQALQEKLDGIMRQCSSSVRLSVK